MEKSKDDLFFAAADETARERSEVSDDHKVLVGDVMDEDGLATPTTEEMESLRHIADDLNISTYRACAKILLRMRLSCRIP
jgi:hypothetical protein